MLNDYITKNYAELLKISQKITHNNDLTEDLCHYCIEILLSHKDDKLIEMMVQNGQIKYFYIAILNNQWNSSSSPFYKEYRKDNFSNGELHENIERNDIYEYDTDLDIKIDFILQMKSNQKFYTKKMLELKFDNDMTYQQISQLTKIPCTSCWNTVQSFRRKTLRAWAREQKNMANAG